MSKGEFQTERTRIISEMLDNPDHIGIYPTKKAFDQLDALFDRQLEWFKGRESAFAAERERQINELKKRETEDFYCHEHDDKEMSKCYVQCPFCERV